MAAHGKSFVQYSKELSHSVYTPLDSVAERQLLQNYASGSVAAFEQLVNSHLRFVIYLLRNYRIPSSVDVMDLIQSGNEGLIEGIKRFNCDKYNCRVFTYCYHWIRFHINKALSLSLSSQSLTVEIDNYYCPACNNLLIEKEETEGILICINCFRKYETTDLEMRKQASVKAKFVSLSDFKVVEEVNNLLENNVNIENLHIAEKKFSNLEISATEDIVHFLFQELSEREKLVLALLFGLKSPFKSKSLEEVGSILHMSGERVRLIRKDALKKLGEVNYLTVKTGRFSATQ